MRCQLRAVVQSPSLLLWLVLDALKWSLRGTVLFHNLRVP
jgi:hypothetical protein